jgi:hypothetical protein
MDGICFNIKGAYPNTFHSGIYPDGLYEILMGSFEHSE